MWGKKKKRKGRLQVFVFAGKEKRKKVLAQSHKGKKVLAWLAPMLAEKGGRQERHAFKRGEGGKGAQKVSFPSSSPGGDKREKKKKKKKNTHHEERKGEREKRSTSRRVLLEY